MEQIVFFLILLALGYGFGAWAERSHYRSILRREKALRDLIVIASKFPPPYRKAPDTFLVCGSVVVSVDYFKRFLASLRNFVGGRIKSYESFIDRGRREAILRMKEQAQRKGANMVINIKIETSSISKGRKGAIGSIEVLAYGTAVCNAGG